MRGRLIDVVLGETFHDAVDVSGVGRILQLEGELDVSHGNLHIRYSDL